MMVKCVEKCIKDVWHYNFSPQYVHELYSPALKDRHQWSAAVIEKGRYLLF